MAFRVFLGLSGLLLLVGVAGLGLAGLAYIIEVLIGCTGHLAVFRCDLASGR